MRRRCVALLSYVYLQSKKAALSVWEELPSFIMQLLLYDMGLIAFSHGYSLVCRSSKIFSRQCREGSTDFSSRYSASL